MPKLNVHIYPSQFTNESRILKITKSLIDKNIFDEIYLMGVHGNGISKKEKIDGFRTIFRFERRLGGERNNLIWKVLKTIEWSFRLFVFLRTKNVYCINCHSLPALPLSVFLKWFKGAFLIYDTHELETETDGSRGIRRSLARMVERICIGYTDEISVVSKSIGAWYKNKYNLPNVWVVQNIPYRNRVDKFGKDVFRKQFNIYKSDTIYLYQGELSHERNVDLLIEIFSELPQDKHIVLMGFGEMASVVEKKSRFYNNIHYHPAVTPQELPSYTNSADIGIHLIADTCLNHRYCLPNKIWEYLNARIPVFVSDLPEMRAVVEGYDCGWTCQVSKNSVIEKINMISKERIEEKRIKMTDNNADFGWHIEEKALTQIYERISA